jgi:hypothetical protein
MSLDVSKLEKARELAGGMVQARCPACAEGGHDRTGEHLRIYPDGRFGCCVHPKDGGHRKRIFALVGVQKSGSFTLRLATPPAMTAAQSVKAALTGFSVRTLRTAISEPVATELMPSQVSQDSDSGQPGLPGDHFRTLRTPISNPRAYASEVNHHSCDAVYMCKDSEEGVLSVLTDLEGEAVLPPTAAGVRLPFLTADGTLSIPFDSPERYHWWRGGQSVAETLKEVRSRMSETRLEEKDAVTV